MDTLLYNRQRSKGIAICDKSPVCIKVSPIHSHTSEVPTLNIADIPSNEQISEAWYDIVKRQRHRQKVAVLIEFSLWPIKAEETFMNKCPGSFQTGIMRLRLIWLFKQIGLPQPKIEEEEEDN